jgi:site-specific DNA-methyltransferase (adenine-specific)
MLELNRLYLMDCMDGMAQFPDKFFELAVVDPPYGVGSVTYMPRTRADAFGGYIDKYEITVATLDVNQRAGSKVDVIHSNNTLGSSGNFGDSNTSPKPEYFDELFRVSKHQIIWGGNYFILPPSRGFVIWRKTTVAESFSMAMCEYAWLSFNANAKVFDGAPQGTAQDPRVHPTQKPVALYRWLLQHYAKPGDKILDTHVGSASSLIACHQMGFDFMGFEIDPDYHKAATERLERARAQVSVFDIGGTEQQTEQIGMEV